VLHSGDLDWQLFHMTENAPSDLVGLWERDAETLVGFVIVYPGFGGFDIQVHPDWRDAAREREMRAWAEARIAEIAAGAGREAPGFFTLVDARDATRIGVLEERGYRRGGAWYRLARRLDAALPMPELPDGFRIRGLAGEDDVVARAAVLAAAFGAEPDAERYHRLMLAPGYDPDLELVAVAPDGRFAAFALGWHDAASGIGQFEPVGTAPEFRGLGLGAALLREGCRRLHARGATRAIIIVDGEEAPAMALYTSVGFEPVATLHTYTCQPTAT
jgi:ribosomal protein S18 acetylase RimI-like enzyme